MGISNKRQGTQWELLFQRMAFRENIAIVRIEDGCRRVGLKKIIPVKQMCDYILSCNNRTAIIDTKTTDAKTFPYSKINPDQVKKMHYLADQGTIAGYVVWFRELDKIVFYSTRDLLDIQEQESLEPCDGTILGSLADSVLLRIFYGRFP